MDVPVHALASQLLQASGIQESPRDLPADAEPPLWARVKAGRAWLGALALTAALAAPGAAWATDPPDLYVGIGNDHGAGCLGSGVTPRRESTGPISVWDECSSHGTTQHSWASAEADYGLLRSSSKGSSTRVDSSRFTGSSTAEFRGLYTFSGPGSSVTTQLNLDLDGRLSLSPTFGGLQGAALVLDVVANMYRGERAYVYLESPNDSLAINFKRGSSYPYDFLDAAADWESLASPSGAHLDLETGAFTVPTDMPILIYVTLYTSFGIRGGGVADADFASTLTFNNDGPVFTLPAGYTVEGDGIVGNRWIGADALPPAPAVPAPGTALLAALGLGLLGLRRRSG